MRNKPDDARHAKTNLFFVGISIGIGFKNALFMINSSDRHQFFSVYRVFGLYEAGLLTREETLKRLKISKLYDQVTFCTEKALSHLQFIGQLYIDKEDHNDE